MEVVEMVEALNFTKRPRIYFPKSLILELEADFLAKEVLLVMAICPILLYKKTVEWWSSSRQRSSKAIFQAQEPVPPIKLIIQESIQRARVQLRVKHHSWGRTNLKAVFITNHLPRICKKRPKIVQQDILTRDHSKYLNSNIRCINRLKKRCTSSISIILMLPQLKIYLEDRLVRDLRWTN